MKIKGRVFPLIASLIFFLVGVALLSLVITSLANEPKYVKTTATVVSAEVRYSDEGKLEAVSTFEYFADGKGTKPRPRQQTRTRQGSRGKRLP